MPITSLRLIIVTLDYLGLGDHDRKLLNLKGLLMYLVMYKFVHEKLILFYYYYFLVQILLILSFMLDGVVRYARGVRPRQAQCTLPLARAKARHECFATVMARGEIRENVGLRVLIDCYSIFFPK